VLGESPKLFTKVKISNKDRQSEARPVIPI
jgi:hypothetical protein